MSIVNRYKPSSGEYGDLMSSYTTSGAATIGIGENKSIVCRCRMSTSLTSNKLCLVCNGAKPDALSLTH